MTNQPTPDDELVSAYLDGVATADEAARIEADPALLARAEQLRAAIEFTAAPVAIPTADLDRIRAIAVAESNTTPAVRDLLAAAAARRERLQTRNRVMAVAAAFVFIALSVAGVRAISNSVESDTSTEAGSGDDSGGDDAIGDFGDDSGDDTAALGPAETTEAADGAGDEDAGDNAAFDAAGDSGGDDGDDMADADGGDDGAATEQTSTTIAAARLALPAELPPVASLDELVGVIETAFATDNIEEAVLELETLACPDTFAEAFAGHGLNFQSADYSMVAVNGGNFVVGAAQLSDGTIVIVAAATVDCLATVLQP